MVLSVELHTRILSSVFPQLLKKRIHDEDSIEILPMVQVTALRIQVL